MWDRGLRSILLVPIMAIRLFRLGDSIKLLKTCIISLTNHIIQTFVILRLFYFSKLRMTKMKWINAKWNYLKGKGRPTVVGTWRVLVKWNSRNSRIPIKSRPRGFRGNVLASRSKVRGFKHGWGWWIFSGRKIPEHKSSGRDLKLGVPSLRFQAR